MTKLIEVVRVCSQQRQTETYVANNILLLEHNIKVDTVHHILELFPLVSSLSFNPDIISIYVENLTAIPGSDGFELLSTLDTLLKCTVVRSKDDDNNQKLAVSTARRNTKIIIAIDKYTDVALVKELLLYSAVAGVMVRYHQDNPNYISSAVNCLPRFIQGNQFIPPDVKKLLSKKKLQTKLIIELTPRQRQIYKLVSEKGASNKVIGKMLNLSESTVKLHLSAIYKKYGVKNRTQLAVFTRPKTEVEPR